MNNDDTDNVICFIPKNWVRYTDATMDFYYNPVEYEIRVDSNTKPYCHYYGDNSIPSQPLGLTDLYMTFAFFEGKYIDLSLWDFTNIKNVSKLFYNCRNLQGFNLGSFNCQSITNTDGMFSFCINLKQIELVGCNFKHLTSMNEMFQCCAKLETLNVQGWYLPKLKSMRAFCENDVLLTELLMNDWFLPTIIDDNNAFFGCYLLDKRNSM